MSVTLYDKANKYKGRCAVCMSDVEAGEGRLAKFWYSYGEKNRMKGKAWKSGPRREGSLTVMCSGCIREKRGAGRGEFQREGKTI